MWKKIPKPKTYLGFPVSHEEAANAQNVPPRQGIAMIMALFMISVMTLFMADMQINSVVQAELAIATRDNIKAEYIAKSGANLASFLLNVDLAVDLTMAELGGPNAQVSDGPGDIWAQLNGFPIGGESLELLGSVQETFDLSKINDSGILDQLKLFDGQFVIDVSDESSRLNINYCGHPRRIFADACQNYLKALMSCPAEKDYLDRKKFNTDEFVGYVSDWVDEDQKPNELTGKSSESDAYADRVPKIQPKNAPFDSLDELGLIPGWDADLQKIFSPYLTVFPIPSRDQGKNENLAINFNSASREFLNCLFPKSVTDCADKSALYIEKRKDEGPVTSSQGVQDALRGTFCAEGDGAKYFTYRSDIYRVKVKGTAGDQDKNIEFVLLRRMPDEFDAKNNYKSPYKYLYWKMM